MNITLTLIRGLPGSGKTDLAELFCENSIHRPYAADDYFEDAEGNYNFDASKLKEAHAACRSCVEDDMLLTAGLIVVHNTFSTRWEMEPYLRMAAMHGYRVHVVDLFDGGCENTELRERNVHSVPLEIIIKMRERWEHDWKVGDPLPPWERPGQ